MMLLRGMIVVFFLCILLESCDQGTGTDQNNDAAQLVNEGWQAYRSKQYGSAADKFAGAIEKDGGMVDAYNGGGWSNAKLNALTLAVSRFTVGLSKDSTNLDMQAGLSFVYNALKNYDWSDSLAEQVIFTDPAWTFSQDPTIGVSAIRLLLAENYFAQAYFALSLQQVQFLNPSFTLANISTVASQDSLSREIERLRTAL